MTLSKKLWQLRSINWIAMSSTAVGYWPEGLQMVRDTAQVHLPQTEDSASAPYKRWLTWIIHLVKFRCVSFHVVWDLRGGTQCHLMENPTPHTALLEYHQHHQYHRFTFKMHGSSLSSLAPQWLSPWSRVRVHSPHHDIPHQVGPPSPPSAPPSWWG